MEGNSTVTSLENHVSSEQRDEKLAKLEVAIQGVIFCLALMGNGLVLCALRRHGRKITRMRFCILHLAIADILVALLNILPQMIWDITYRFEGNDALCRLVKFGQVFVMYLSTYILVITAVDRYVAICHPFCPPSVSKTRTKIMLLIAWIMSLIFSVPQLFIFQYQRISPDNDTFDCWATFDPTWTMQVYITCFTFVIYIIPLCVLVYTYGRIGYTVWGSCCTSKRKYLNKLTSSHCSHVFSADTTATGSAPVSTPAHETLYTFQRNDSQSDMAAKAVSEKKIKTVRLTFVVVIAYVICWSPFFVTQLWWSYDSSAPTDSGVFVIMLLLASLNSCCNPWIYLVFSGGLLRASLPCFNHAQIRRCQPPKPPKDRVKVKWKESPRRYFAKTNQPSWGKRCSQNRFQVSRNLCPHVRHVMLRHSQSNLPCDHTNQRIVQQGDFKGMNNHHPVNRTFQEKDNMFVRSLLHSGYNVKLGCRADKETFEEIIEDCSQRQVVSDTIFKDCENSTRCSRHTV